MGEPRWSRLSSMMRLLCHEPSQHWHFPALHRKFNSRLGELGRCTPNLDEYPSLFSPHKAQHLQTQPKIPAGTEAWLEHKECVCSWLCCRKPLPNPFPSTSPGHHETFKTQKCHSSDLSQSSMDLTFNLTLSWFHHHGQSWLPTLSLSLSPFHSPGIGAMGLGCLCGLNPGSPQIRGFQSCAALSCP